MRYTTFILTILLGSCLTLNAQTGTFSIVDTDQTNCYNNTSVATCPSVGAAFYGQDAQYTGNSPSYQDNGDGTVTDLNTGLMWQQGFNAKMTFDNAKNAVNTFSLAGHSDWRLPTIKELYSLIQFSGYDVSSWNDTIGAIPFIDTSYFPFAYGDPNTERIIDAQYWSSNVYNGLTMGQDSTVFGVNFADGRIKGYPSQAIGPPGNQSTMTSYTKFVRGGNNYGTNNFVDNGDGTITDLATGLMWLQDDSGHLNAGSNNDGTMNWEDALDWAENLTTAGYSDWRLPDAKELQSIVDYTRSPSMTSSPAIDPVFNTSTITDEGGGTNYPFYWTSTTHASTATNGAHAVYVVFGEALGFMESPPGSGSYTLLDVHGAGAQRSDLKDGDPANYPTGWGPQGDVVRIFNHSRPVRLTSTTSIEEMNHKIDMNVFPSPNSGTFNIAFTLFDEEDVKISIINTVGKVVDVLTSVRLGPGKYDAQYPNNELNTGIYFIKIETSKLTSTQKVIIQK